METSRQLVAPSSNCSSTASSALSPGGRVVSVDPTLVKLYSGGFTDSGNFGDYLNVTVDEGDGGTFADCTGFVEDDAGAEFSDTLTQFDALHTNYGNGVGEWDPSAAGQFKTYQITVELDAATPNAEQNESVTALTFTWEVQS